MAICPAANTEETVCRRHEQSGATDPAAGFQGNKGQLNGTVSAGAAGSSPQSNLTATFSTPVFPPESTSIPPYPVNVIPFQTGNLMNYLNITNPDNNGQSIQANLITTPNVPEPSSIAIFAWIAGLGLWQRRRKAS